MFFASKVLESTLLRAVSSRGLVDIVVRSSIWSLWWGGRRSNEYSLQRCEALSLIEPVSLWGLSFVESTFAFRI